MFKTARMRKLNVITLDTYAGQAVSALHDAGIVQISDISERIQQDPELAEVLKPSKVTPYTGKISSLLMKTTALSDLLGDALSEGLSLKEKLSSLINPDIPVPKEIDDIGTEAFIDYAEGILAQVEGETQGIEEKLAALESEKSVMESNKSLAENLSPLDMDLGLLADSKFTSTFVGRTTAESAEKFKAESSKITDQIFIETVPDGKEFFIMVVVVSDEFKDDVFTLLRKIEFEKFEIGDVEGKPSEIIASAESRLLTIESEKSQAKAELKVVAEKWDDEVLALKEQLENEKEKNEVFASFAETKKAVVFEAWVPVKDTEKAESVIEASTENHCIIDIEEVPDDSEDVPVLQQNGAYAKPYELLVGMYAPLKYNEIDPTIFVALTFPFFFGFCLTDAFYGAIVVILGIILYAGMGKINETMKSGGLIIIASGLWAIILGLVTNGLLGDFYTRILGMGDALPTVIPSLNAFANPATILVIAIVVGLIYTNIGFLIGAINNYRYGNKKDAWGSQIVWFIFEIGIVLLALGFLNPAIGMIGMIIGGVFIVASLGILIWANGAYGLMDVFGYMGDVLSYARLLALCLATGGIAMTVNIVANLCNDLIPFVGIILFVIVMIFGHIANFLFQVLGAGVNALRLNYVEFFSQFFLGGKHSFEAFKAQRMFTKIRK
ncbi:MAG: V-type ATP synthase subunit I [Methanobacteriaceae archaeon]|nr:V-type ATP synthase subunit I [Methanobacteriaceae archaeon]